MRTLVVAAVAAMLMGGTALGVSTVTYTLEIGGDNHYGGCSDDPCNCYVCNCNCFVDLVGPPIEDCTDIAFHERDLSSVLRVEISHIVRAHRTGPNNCKLFGFRIRRGLVLSNVEVSGRRCVDRGLRDPGWVARCGSV